MDRIINELNNADKSTREALKNIENASEKIAGHFQITTNIYTEGGNVSLEKLGEVIDNNIAEMGMMQSVVKHLENIIEVKDTQMKLMLDTLVDNKNQIDELKTELLRSIKQNQI